jgi:hypothetical protein
MCPPPLMIDGAIEMEAKRKKMYSASLTLYCYVWRVAART